MPPRRRRSRSRSGMRIEIKPQVGRKFHLKVLATDTIGDVKAKIQEHQPDLTTDQQLLVYRGKVLENHRVLSHVDFVGVYPMYLHWDEVAEDMS